MNHLQAEDPINNNLNKEDEENDSGDDSDAKPTRRSGRRKIKIEYIEDKNRRHITFSKRKAGIMKKAYELSTLTGTQVLLLVVSETGLVYTFTTVKLQPIVTKPEGKNLIQACLNAPDPSQGESNDNDYASGSGQSRVDIEKKPSASFKSEKSIDAIPPPPTAAPSNAAAAPPNSSAPYPNSASGPYQQQQPYGGNTSAPPSQPGGPQAPQGMPPMSGYGHPGYMNPAPYGQSPQQPPYGGPAPNYYGNQQQQHYMQQQQQQQPQGYWEGDDKARRGLPPNNNKK